MTDRPQPPPLVKTIAQLASSKIYRFALQMLTGVMRPLLLTPELFGIWNLFSVIIQSAIYFLNLGCHFRARFLLPYHWGRGEDAEAERIKGTILIGILVPHVLYALGIVAVALVLDWEDHIRDGLLVISVIVVLIWYHRYLLNVLSSRHNFKPITHSNYIMATLALFLGTPLIYLFSIYGLYATALIDYIIIICFLKYHCREKTTEGFHWVLYKKLLAEGFPIMAFDLASFLVRHADRVLIATFLGTEQLGYYALAAFIFTALLEVPGAARDVLEPRMMHDISSMTSEDFLHDYFFRPMVNCAYYIPLLIGPAIFVAPFIDVILPRYADAIVPAQLLALGSYFLATSYVARGVVVAYGWQVKALGRMIAVAVINVALSTAAMKAGYGIAGVAVAGTTSYALLLGLMIQMVWRHHPSKKIAWGKQVVSLIWPFIFLVALVGGLVAAADLLGLGRWLAAALQLIVFGIAAVGFLHLSHRAYPLVQRPGVGQLFGSIKAQIG